MNALGLSSACTREAAENMSEHLSEDMSKDTSKDMSKDMSEDMSEPLLTSPFMHDANVDSAVGLICHLS